LLRKGSLTIPTQRELIRVKAFLLYDRNYTRDFFDFAELACLLDADAVVEALVSLNCIFAWEDVSAKCREIGAALSLKVRQLEK
jgi:hypothetical protein